MNKKISKGKFLLLPACILLLFIILFCSIAGSYFTIVSDNTVDADAAASLNSNYAAFAHKSTFRYTDLNKVESTHSGATSDDTSLIVVDRNQAHGTIDNPYVITNIAQWNYFATNSSSGATDSTKVFVLGADIDFTGVTFNAVDDFQGKFYGGGHTLSNITKNFGTQNECGVFRVIGANAILADINVDNVSISSTGGRVGSLLGSTDGGDILNCHVKGRVEGMSSFITIGGSAQNSGTHYAVGGLIGNANGSNSTKLYVYRCSVDVDITANMKAIGASSGGILGASSCVDNSLSMAFYDCLVIAKLTVNGSGNNDTWFGGITNFVSFIGEQAIENCVTYITVHNNSSYRLLFASLFNGWPTAMSKLSIKNVYSNGVLNHASAAYGLPGAIWFNGWSLPIANAMTLDTENINYFADKTITYTTSQTFDFYAHRTISHTKYTGAANLTQNDMYANAQNIMPSNIWKQ